MNIMNGVVIIRFYRSVADSENQRVDGDHCEKQVFEAYSRQYNPYLFVFVEEK